MYHYSVSLVGEQGTGKSSIMKRLVTGEFSDLYKPTVVATQYQVEFFTKDKEKIIFHVAECPGGLIPVDTTDATIVVGDTSNILSVCYLKYLSSHLCSKTPFVLIGNKVDKGNRFLPSLTGFDSVYIPLSSKSNYNYEKPWLTLARILRNNPTLEFTLPPIQPLLAHE